SVAPGLRLDPGQGVGAVGEALVPAVGDEYEALALALAHAAEVLYRDGVAQLERLVHGGADVAAVRGADDDDRPGAFGSWQVDVRGESDAVAHRHHLDLGRLGGAGQGREGDPQRRPPERA